MRRNKKQNQNRCRGQAAIIAVLFLMSAMLVVTGGFSSLALRQAKIVRAADAGSKSYFLAEAGIEDAVYRLKTGREISDTETLVSGGTAESTVITRDGDIWNIRAEGETKENIRAVAVSLTLGDDIQLNYGVQAGEGGFEIDNTASVIGNVFSNGPVEGENSNMVRGTVVSAGQFGRVLGIHATSSVYAYAIEDSFIEKDAYFQTIDGATTVLGTKYPGSASVATSPLPISDETLDEWEAAALAGGSISSPCPYEAEDGAALGPVKINCDLTIAGNAAVTLRGTVLVAGNVTVKNTSSVRIDPSAGEKSVAIIAHNPSDMLAGSRVEINNQAFFAGTGAEDSYILVVSRNRSAEDGGSVRAIDIANQSDAGALLVYAPHGEILIQNKTVLREVSGYKIHLKNSAEVEYKTGLANLLFDAGPSGGYDILEWREVE
ncbi:MAG: hypothetical protein HYY60_00635 [Parcubacteria group bacterium]|nr:hypothetical protein [Parcubacteria group bacterium]MBI3075181.1 hypothetical protein [Parcubacteria group bacterium]